MSLKEVKEFKVNKYITLKLENGKTFIYVNNRRFNQCKFLLLNININEIKSFDEIKSVDESIIKFDNFSLSQRKKAEILDPDAEFWGHCSNLQVWYEYDYDTRLIHSNLVFPLLKKLVDVGDPLAKKVFKEEIAKRFITGYKPVLDFLINQGFLEYLSDQELEYIFSNPRVNPIKHLDMEELGLENFPNFIIKLSSLEILNLRCNYIRMLPSPIERLNKIKQLDLSANKLESLPDTIGNLSSLEVLNLFANKLSYIPNSIAKLDNLKRLNLGCNNFSKFPTSLKDLKSLQFLDLQQNSLKSIPIWINKLNSIQDLNLVNTELKELPNEIGNLFSLKTLELSLNQIEELPDSIGNLRSLEYLFLDKNNLISLPKSITRLKSLKKLKIDWKIYKQFSDYIEILEKREVKVIY